jgi:autotransporter-associated beta strand protein
MATEFSSLDNLNAFLAGKAPVAVESTAARGKTSVDYLDLGGANGTTALPPAVIASRNGDPTFIAQLSGKFNAAVGGDYTFQTRSDDNSMVYIDGQAVVDNNRDQGQTVRTGVVSLTPGLHDIVVAYRQGSGGGGFSVGVTAAGQGQSYTLGSELNMSNSLLSHGSSQLTIGSLSGAATSSVLLNGGKLIIGIDNTSTTFSGVISDGSAAGGQLSKLGGGIQTLTGISTYTGETVVSGGNLRVNGDISTSSVTRVLPGGTLSGTGKVGAVDMAGGAIAPGASPGILNTGSVVTSSSSSNFQFEIGGLTAGSQYDQINTTGTISLDGILTLSLVGGFTPTPGNQFFPWLNDGTDPISGTFAGVPEGGVVTAGGSSFAVSYTGNGDGGSIGNDIRLTALVPEPSAATLATGAALLVLRRRRRCA